jgi:peroxiredoxin
LLSDVDRTVGTAYQVARNADDQYAALPKRYSYLIDPDGVIRRSYRVADVGSHAGEVLADLASLAQS